MVRPKARFVGEQGPRIAAQKDGTRHVIGEFLGQYEAADRLGWSANLIDGLVDELAGAAWFARQTVLFAEQDSSLQDTKAELLVLLRCVESADVSKLTEVWPTLSPDVWWAIRRQIDLDQFERGDFSSLSRLRLAVTTALDEYNTQKRRPHEAKHAAARELARRVHKLLAPLAPDMRMSLSAYADSGGQSAIIELLGSIGDSIGLSLAPTVWRDILSEIRRGR